ncbi:MAG TPA: mismatch-specific DNA-glycosylase [Nitrospira sp.]
MRLAVSLGVYLQGHACGALWQNSGSPPNRLSPRVLPDYIQPGLHILFVGINPGHRSAAVGHHFAGHSNRFWKLLFDSRLITDPLTFEQDWRLPEWKLGLTNVIRRSTSGIDVLMPKEYTAGRKRLIALVRQYQPKLLALLGVTIYRHFFHDNLSAQPIQLGLQTNTLAGTRIFVLPNPSGRNAHYSYETMLSAFRRLREEAGSQ